MYTCALFVASRARRLAELVFAPRRQALDEQAAVRDL
jgi:hypothetical protein